MLDRCDLEPLFFAPFVSSIMKVEPAWIDYNGHLNMAYYNVLFDRAVDEAYELIGIGHEYLQRRRHSTFTAEVHVRYLRELHAGDPVRATFQRFWPVRLSRPAAKASPAFSMGRISTSFHRRGDAAMPTWFVMLG